MQEPLFEANFSQLRNPTKGSCGSSPSSPSPCASFTAAPSNPAHNQQQG